jgi:hypothetical protein
MSMVYLFTSKPKLQTTRCLGSWESIFILRALSEYRKKIKLEIIVILFLKDPLAISECYDLDAS